jgi:hypothetical protein
VSESGDRPGFDFNLKELGNTLGSVIENEMTHAGDLHNLPAMPFPQGARGETDAYLMWKIARSAARRIIEAQLPKFVRQMRRDITEGGIEKIRQLYQLTSDTTG